MYKYCILDYTEYSISDCDSGDTVPEISDDCLSEFQNAVVNGNVKDAFLDRCGSDDTFKDRCSLCCVTGMNHI